MRRLLVLILLLTAACSPAAASSLPDAASAAPTSAPVDVRPQDTPTAPPVVPVQASPTAFDAAQLTPAADTSPTPAPTPTATPCPPDLCIYTGRLHFARPIGPEGRQTVDLSYPFASTQDGTRDVHHGVEFLNGHGTPVLAAADGVVVVAGDDREVFYGPYSYFYGNLVVLQHDLPEMDQPVYTLYGHLSELLVEVGDTVQAGQEIGRVGMSGVATGSHLHFEVRVGENSYQNSRNPVLWLIPLKAENGDLRGALAGRVLTPQDQWIDIPNIVIEHLPAPDQPPVATYYTRTYEEKSLAGLPPYEESFAMGDLQPGWYRIRFVQFGFQERIVQVLPGQLTLVTFDLRDG
jgi:murein DD-endopeptidase MepM/ murein hydrolase activator NlpD